MSPTDPKESDEEIPLRRQIYAYLLLLFAIGIWASAFAGIRVVLEELDPLTLTVIRLLLASLALGTIAAMVGVKMPHRRDLPKIFGAGLSGFTLYHALLNLGMTQVSAGQASFIIATTPIWTAMLAWRFLSERLSLMSVLGLILSLGGVAYMSLGEHDVGMGLGSLLVLCAAISAGVNITLQKSLLARYKPLEVTLHVMVAGSLPMLLYLPIGMPQLLAMSTTGWWVTLYLAFVPIALGYYLGTIALSILPAYRNAQLLLLIAPCASLIAWVWIGEQPDTKLAFGGLLILAGVVLGGKNLAPRWWRRFTGGLRKKPDASLEEVLSGE